ncbi:hypothetical protein [Streptococcus thoraltensis]
MNYLSEQGTKVWKVLDTQGKSKADYAKPIQIELKFIKSGQQSLLLILEEYE